MTHVAPAAPVHLGTYPFGSPLRRVVQTDRTPKRVFVLGVYASAVHAKWYSAEDKLLVRALAVASEPTIFWDGSNAAEVISAIPVPQGAGRLVPADSAMNGPSGRALDKGVLGPLGLTRRDTWLCDLVPHTCANPSQAKALDREYVPRMQALGLPAVNLPPVPPSFANDQRRGEVLEEVEASKPDVIVLLGDEPIKHFLAKYVPARKRLAEFGETDETYGRLHPVVIAGKRYSVLPLAHPRQIDALGAHSRKWHDLHDRWVKTTAAKVLGGTA